MIHTFFPPPTSPPKFNSDFRHPLVFSIYFPKAAEGIRQMASHHPHPLCSKPYFLCISFFRTTATKSPFGAYVCVPVSSYHIHGDLGGGGGSGRVWPVPRPRVSSISADEYQGLADLSAPSPMRLKRYWRSSAL